MIYTCEIPLKHRTKHFHYASENIFVFDVMEAKRCKILSHQFSKHSDYSIWVDGNIELNISESECIEKYLGDAELGIFKHPYRNCIYQEFDVLINDTLSPRLADPILKFNLRNQRDYYKSLAYPFNNGLFECNFIIRRNTKNIAILNNFWWSEICFWQHRDQVSFPYVLWYLKNTLGIEINMKVTESNIRENKDFNYIKKY